MKMKIILNLDYVIQNVRQVTAKLVLIYVNQMVELVLKPLYSIDIVVEIMKIILKLEYVMRNVEVEWQIEEVFAQHQGMYHILEAEVPPLEHIQKNAQ